MADQNPNIDINWDSKSAPKLSFEECYYQVLEINPDATSSAIKKAFYKLVLKYHPDSKDTQDEKDLCNKQMMVINGAYRILKEDKLRIEYDKKRRQGYVGISSGVKDTTSTSNSDSTSNTSSTSKKNPPSSTSRSSSARGSTSRSSRSSSSSTSRSNSAGFGGAWTRKSNIEEEIYNDMFEEFYTSTGGESPEREREREKQRERRETIRNKSILDDIEEYLRKQQQTQESADRRERERERGWGERERERESSRTGWDEVFQRPGGYIEGEDTSPKMKSLRRREKEIQNQVNNRGRLLTNDERDWGDVQDVRAIQKRLDDINELKDLRGQLRDVQAEITSLLWRLKSSSSYTSSRSVSHPSPSVSPSSVPSRSVSPSYEDFARSPPPGSYREMRERERERRRTGTSSPRRDVRDMFEEFYEGGETERDMRERERERERERQDGEREKEERLRFLMQNHKHRER